MRRFALSGLWILLTLSLGSSSLDAQKPRGSDPPRGGKTCTCTGGEADCLFGYAAGCSITCPGKQCSCQGAWCFLGFPRPSRCKCKAGPQA
jgi:hypothetical protein